MQAQEEGAGLSCSVYTRGYCPDCHLNLDLGPECAAFLTLVTIRYGFAGGVIGQKLWVAGGCNGVGRPSLGYCDVYYLDISRLTPEGTITNKGDVYFSRKTPFSFLDASSSAFSSDLNQSDSESTFTGGPCRWQTARTRTARDLSPDPCPRRSLLDICGGTSSVIVGDKIVAFGGSLCPTPANEFTNVLRTLDTGWDLSAINPSFLWRKMWSCIRLSSTCTHLANSRRG